MRTMFPRLYMKQIGLQSDAKPATPLSKICYAAYPNSYIFQADGKIGKCTVALKDEKNCIGQVEESGIVLNEELNNEWRDLENEGYHEILH